MRKLKKANMFCVVQSKLQTKLTAILTPLVSCLIIGFIFLTFTIKPTTIFFLSIIPLVLIIVGVKRFSQAKDLHLKVTKDEISWIDIVPKSNHRILTSDIKCIRYIKSKHADSHHSDKIFLDLLNGKSLQLRTIHVNPIIVHQKLRDYIQQEKFEINE